ncbi:glycerophosphodiester phosphodiesterase [Microbacterium oxydans]|uniref:glycerophosphodiester phosphodiesterase n=1 Tax=Microbacterium oxydans TaxID=82380 RepID=UPI0024AD5576|nr:glycerophosphodiester phosphodiesterase family protein [Microbacterium oxydans]
MADAAVLGTAYTRVNDSLSPAVSIADVPVGAWVIVSLMSASSTATFTAPAGWEVLKAVETTGTRRNQMWGRVKQLGDGTTATFTTSVLNAMTFGVVWGTGDWANRVVGASRTRSTVGASPRSQNIAPSLTAPASSVVVAVTQEATSAQVASDEITGTSPAGWTRARWVEQIPNYLETIGIYQKPMSTAGASGDLSVTYSSSQDSNGWAVQVAIPSTAPAVTPPGFSSVSQMLATPGATWAHRGGSTNWPEMSKYAYEQAALAGYGALEFSANRTSDGVWVGVHDASLNRTSQTTGLPDISAMTWAQVQTYQNSLNAAGTPRPYYRLDQFLDDFTGTHVVIVDPKHAIGAYNTEFLNLLDAHGGNTKIVVKFYGVGAGATGLADAATARGYQTWGYFYDTDVTSGGLAADQSHWSILGMNYDAAQSAWDAVLAYGKPVVGHIAASQANYNTAISRGARMVQCANVAGIAAVGASTLTGTGTLHLSGTATRTLSITRTGVGTLGIDGAAARTVSVARAGTGELAVTGTAVVGLEVNAHGAGELGLSGSGTTTAEVQRTGAGVLELDGAASVSAEITRTGVGELTLTGQGIIDDPAVEWPARLTLEASIDALNLTATVPELTLEATW